MYSGFGFLMDDYLSDLVFMFRFLPWFFRLFLTISLWCFVRDEFFGVLLAAVTLLYGGWTPCFDPVLPDPDVLLAHTNDAVRAKPS